MKRLGLLQKDVVQGRPLRSHRKEPARRRAGGQHSWDSLFTVLKTGICSVFEGERGGQAGWSAGRRTERAKEAGWGGERRPELAGQSWARGFPLLLREDRTGGEEHDREDS